MPFHNIVPSPSTALGSPNTHFKGLCCINQSVLVWSCSFSDSICIGHRKQCPHYGQICIRMSSSRTGPYCGTRYWCGAGKVIIHKLRREVSLVEQDTIENISAAYHLKFCTISLRKYLKFSPHLRQLFSADATILWKKFWWLFFIFSWAK